ncbi:hypothetical protein [Streptomyces sp. NPDC126514]|uniref:hypothetical protein n=1 Tax=Streptomyces sp. NPDC126514 TaxID=3155210 RepID=UPI0033193782
MKTPPQPCHHPPVGTQRQHALPATPDHAAKDTIHTYAVTAYLITSCALIQLTTLCLLTLSGTLPAPHACLMATPAATATATSLLALLTTHTNWHTGH